MWNKFKDISSYRPLLFIRHGLESGRVCGALIMGDKPIKSTQLCYFMRLDSVVFFFLPRCSRTWELAPVSEHRADFTQFLNQDGR
jgi:hypothetical protein